MRVRLSHQPEWLRARGYDGLYAPLDAPFGGGACGCSVDDFAPCGEGPFPECVPAEMRGDDVWFYPAKRKRAKREPVSPHPTKE